MNYDGNTFYELMDKAAAQGAEHLDAQCKGHHHTIDHSNLIKKHSQPGNPGRKMTPHKQEVTLGSCAQSVLFHVPFEGEKRDDGVMGLTVCAVDDAMGSMPRFGGDRLAKLPRKELFYLAGDKLDKNDPRVLGK